MENYLKHDFITHHNLPVCNITIAQYVNYLTFEIDDVSRNLIVRNGITNGMAKYENPTAKNITIVDYDNFLTSTPHNFQHGKKRCDVILHTTNDTSYFLLNELKDRTPKTEVLTGAVNQLIATLNELYTTPSIISFISSFNVKKCCYCNRQSTAPINISAPIAFNRLSGVAPEGLLLSNVDIENLGFELWEYSDNQTIKLS